MELVTNSGESNIQDNIIKLIRGDNLLMILSPYLTETKASEFLLNRSDIKLKMVIGLNLGELSDEQLSQLSVNVDLELLDRMIQAKHDIRYNPKLHSKLYLTNKQGVLGSANFTKNGLSGRLESVLSFQEQDSLRYSPIVGQGSKLMNN